MRQATQWLLAAMAIVACSEPAGAQFVRPVDPVPVRPVDPVPVRPVPLPPAPLPTPLPAPLPQPPTVMAPPPVAVVPKPPPAAAPVKRPSPRKCWCYQRLPSGGSTRSKCAPECCRGDSRDDRC